MKYCALIIADFIIFILIFSYFTLIQYLTSFCFCILLKYLKRLL